MVKKSKRTRKFESTGGVKRRLEKGTITKKGKTKQKKRTSKGSDDAANLDQAKTNTYSKELLKKREDGNFVSEKNLGDLDMESFFSTFAECCCGVCDVPEFYPVALLFLCAFSYAF